MNNSQKADIVSLLGILSPWTIHFIENVINITIHSEKIIVNLSALYLLFILYLGSKGKSIEKRVYLGK